jgi:hypothetical protein
MKIVVLTELKQEIQLVTLESPAIPRVGEKIRVKFEALSSVADFTVKGVLFRFDDNNVFEEVVVAVEL